MNQQKAAEPSKPSGLKATLAFRRCGFTEGQRPLLVSFTQDLVQSPPGLGALSGRTNRRHGASSPTLAHGYQQSFFATSCRSQIKSQPPRPNGHCNRAVCHYLAATYG